MNKTLTFIKQYWRRFTRAEWERMTGYTPDTIVLMIKAGELTKKQEEKIQTNLINWIDELHSEVIDLCKKD